MGVDMHITVLGRKESDSVEGDTLYRALEFYRKDGDKYSTFDFPYFRNSFFFQEFQDRFGRKYWNGIRSNVENPDIIKWYDKSYEEDCKNLPIDERKSFLWGHTWVRLKDLMDWDNEVRTTPVRGDDPAAMEERDEILNCIEFMYESAKKMLGFDMILVDRFDFEYDIDNSILLIAFDN